MEVEAVALEVEAVALEVEAVALEVEAVGAEVAEAVAQVGRRGRRRTDRGFVRLPSIRCLFLGALAVSANGVLVERHVPDYRDMRHLSPELGRRLGQQGFYRADRARDRSRRNHRTSNDPFGTPLFKEMNHSRRGLVGADDEHRWVVRIRPGASLNHPQTAPAILSGISSPGTQFETAVFRIVGSAGVPSGARPNVNAIGFFLPWQVRAERFQLSVSRSDP